MLVLLGLAAGWFVAQRRSRLLGDPLTELAVRAERLGAGESRFMPLNSGIGELDRISDVLSRSAHQVTRNLAAERDFAADASHQLRTPLTALLMRLDEIASTDDLGVVQEEAQVAIDQVERLSKVVDDLMGRTRVSDPTRPSVSLDAVLASLQREWQPAFAVVQAEHADPRRARAARAGDARWRWPRSSPPSSRTPWPTAAAPSTSRPAGPGRPSSSSSVTRARVSPRPSRRTSSSGRSRPRARASGLTLARDLAEDNGGRLELVSTQPAVFAVFLSEAE